MINLGKTLLFLLFLASWAHAAFSATVNKTRITQGEQLVLTFSSDVSSDFPIISEIEGFAIENSSREESTSIINGRRTGSYKVHYVFTPTHSITIPSFEMIEPSKKVRTQPIAITVEKQKAPNRSDELFFSMTASKKSVYEGEPFFVTIEYRQQRDLDIIDRRLSAPTGDHFWIDQKPIESKHDSATHEIVQLKYIFTAQKAGALSINPANIKVGARSYKRDAWGMLRAIPEYKTLFTDTIHIDVKPLPQGVANVGDFAMDVRVDRSQSNEKEPVNLIITLKGEGNIEDIVPFKLDIPGVLVYDEEPIRTHEIRDGHYVGNFEQRFALLSDQDYTIPGISFSYFSLKEGRVKTIQSNALHVGIHPTAMAKSQEVVVQKAIQEPAVSSQERTLWVDALLVIAGLVLGVGLSVLRPFLALLRKPRKKKTIKDDKTLLKALIPFSQDDPQVAAIVEALSENIYKQAGHTIDAKELKAIKKRYLQ